MFLTPFRLGRCGILGCLFLTRSSCQAAGTELSRRDKKPRRKGWVGGGDMDVCQAFHTLSHVILTLVI